MATPQEILADFKRSSKELNVKEESILKKLEENKVAIDKFYDDKINELNNITPPFVDENGNNIVFDASTVLGDKAEYLKMYYAEYDAKNPVQIRNGNKGKFVPKTQTQKFQAELKNETRRIENSNQGLKSMAESVLKYKVSLIEKNKQAIEDVKISRDTADERSKALQDEITALTEKLKDIDEDNKKLVDEYDDLDSSLTLLEDKKKDLEDEKNNIINELSVKNNELQQAKADNKPQDVIDALEIEVNDLTGKLNINSNELTQSQNDIADLKQKIQINLDNSDTNNILYADIESKKDAKQAEKDAIPDKVTYDAIVSEMEKTNKELEESLDKNILDFQEKFEEVDIDFDISNKVVETETEEIVNDNACEGNKKENKENVSSNSAPSSSNIVQNNVEESGSSIVALDDKKEAKFRVDTFINSSFDEQKRMLDYYGYAQLADVTSRIGPFQRKKLTNVLERHMEKSIPTKDEFKNAVNLIAGPLGINAEELYDNLITNDNNSVPFNKVELDKLKEINSIISHFNQNKEKFSEKDIKEFDAKFMQYIKTSALLQKAKTGRIKSFFSGLNAKSSQILGIVNNMSAYTWQNADSVTEINNRVNNIRSSLGAAVNSEPITRIDSKSRNNFPEIHR